MDVGKSSYSDSGRRRVEVVAIEKPERQQRLDRTQAHVHGLGINRRSISTWLAQNIANECRFATVKNSLLKLLNVYILFK